MKNLYSILGIDFGTTNSVEAVWKRSSYDENEGTVTTIPNKEGTHFTPTAVHFESAASYLVGIGAVESSILAPEKNKMGVKRELGRIPVSIVVDGKAFSPQQVAAMVLQDLKESAEEMLEKEVKRAVITVPAYASDAYKKALKQAAELAGIEVVALIGEPEAALCGCDVMHEMNGKLVLIFDFGGGTLDILVAYVSENEIEELAIAGNNHLGGSDCTEALMNCIEETVLQGKSMYPEDKQAFYLDVERAKKSLSRREKTRITVSTTEGRIPVEISQQMFVDCCAEIIKEIEKVLDGLMNELAEIGVGDIDKILMVGGATRMPFVRELLKKRFPYADIYEKDQDEIVAKGAAIYAKMLEDNEINNTPNKGIRNVKQTFKKRLRKISARSYGVRALVGAKRTPMVCNIIIKSTELPVEVTKNFTLSMDNQTSARLEVYENTSNARHAELTEDTRLGDCVLDLAENLTQEAKVQVTLSLDLDGVLHVKGVDPVSGNEVETRFEGKALLGGDELVAQAEELEGMEKLY